MASDSRLVETDELAPAVWQVDEAKGGQAILKLL